MQDPKVLYDEILAGKISPADIEVSSLFELGDRLAISSGDFEAKSLVYAWIHNHPKATEDDRIRVEIFHYDMLRRSGEAQDAYVRLHSFGDMMPPRDEMPPPEFSLMAKLEWLQAVAQCLLVLQRFDEAVTMQRRLIGLIDESVPMRRQLYYLETMLALKQHANQYDDELKNSIQQYGLRLNQAKELSDEEQNRAKAGMYFVEGQRNLHEKLWMCAIDCFYQEFSFATNDREKAVASLMAIYTRLQEFKNSNTLAPFIGFLTEHIKDLQKTDIQILQAEHDLVTAFLG